MARIDVPTMQCDRCKTTTQDLDWMGRYRSLTGMYDKYQGASEKWDLCPACWDSFLSFIGGKMTIMTASGTFAKNEAGIQHDGDSS